MHSKAFKLVTNAFYSAAAVTHAFRAPFLDWQNRTVMFNERAADDFKGIDNNDAFVNVAWKLAYEKSLPIIRFLTTELKR